MGKKARSSGILAVGVAAQLHSSEAKRIEARVHG